MEFRPAVISPLSFPAEYYTFLPGYPQSATDGNTLISDTSNNSNNALIDGGTTYANVLANNTWLTATSNASLGSTYGFSIPNFQLKYNYTLWQPNTVVPIGTFVAVGNVVYRAAVGGTTGTVPPIPSVTNIFDNQVTWVETNVVNGLWDLSHGGSLVVAFQFKATANPTTVGNLFGNGSATTPGVSATINSSGRIQVTVTSTTATYTTGFDTGTSFCTGTTHTVVLVIDGTNKAIYLQVDGVTINNVYGASLSSLVGSTVNLTNGFSFGSIAGSATWDPSGTSPNVQFRNIHILIKYTPFENIPLLLKYFSQNNNVFTPVPSNIL